MSKAEKIFVALGILTVVIAALTLWVALEHEREHRSDLMFQIGLILFVLIYFVGGSYVLYRNLRDARRAKSLHAQIVVLKDEHKESLNAQEKRHAVELERKQIENNRLVSMLASKQEEIAEMETRYLQNINRVKIEVACGMLADEAGQLWEKLRSIRSDATVPGRVDEEAVAALKTPLVDAPWPWHSRSLLEFRYMYSIHQTRVGKFGPLGFKSDLTSFVIPTTNKDCEATLTLLLTHRNKLIEQFQDGKVFGAS